MKAMVFFLCLLNVVAVQAQTWTYTLLPVITKQRADLYKEQAEQGKETLEESIQGLEDGLNLRYINSNIPVRVKIEHHIIGDGTMVQDLESETPRSNNWFSKFLRIGNIDALRHQYKADVVMLFVADNGGGNAGLHRCNKPVVSGECRWWNGSNSGRVGALYHMTTAHEIGHNMGLVHSFPQKQEGTEFVWGRGHGVNGKFATQMAYSEDFPDAAGKLAPKAPYFSNPDIIECKGRSDVELPCGVAHDQENSADAASAITAILPYFTTSYDLAGDMAIADLTDSPLKDCALQMENAKENEDMNGGEQNTRDFNFDLVYTSQLSHFNCIDQDFSGKSLLIEHFPFIKKISLTNLQAQSVIFNGSGDLDRVTEVSITDSQISGKLTLSSQWIEKIWLRDNTIESVNFTGMNKLIELKAWGSGLKGSIDLSNKPDLKTIQLGENPNISLINLTGSNNIESLYLRNAGLTGNLDLSAMQNLIELNLEINKVDSLQLPQNTRIKNVKLWGNPIAVSDLMAFRNIQTLNITNTSKMSCWQQNALTSRHNIDTLISDSCTVFDGDSDDNDADGIVNSQDSDNDNDGISNAEEASLGLDQYEADSVILLESENNGEYKYSNVSRVDTMGISAMLAETSGVLSYANNLTTVVINDMGFRVAINRNGLTDIAYQGRKKIVVKIDASGKVILLLDGVSILKNALPAGAIINIDNDLVKIKVSMPDVLEF